MVGVRCILEVLKWSDYPDLTLHLSQVNRQWHTATGNPEVWDTLCEAYDYDPTHTESHPRISFCKQYYQLTLYLLDDGVMRGYNVQKDRWTPSIAVHTKIPFDKSTSLVLYPPFVVATGTGHPITGQSALIDPTTGEMTPLPDMIQPRCRHGSIRYKDWVYVFAGSTVNDGCTDTCEKMNLERRVGWHGVGNLVHSAAYATPCRKGTFIYLFGGWGSTVCQRFDLSTEIFTSLPFSTPLLGDMTTSFVHFGHIYFLQTGYFCQNIDDLSVQITPFQEGHHSNWFGSMPGICFNDVFYLLSIEFRVIKINLSTLQIDYKLPKPRH